LNQNGNHWFEIELCGTDSNRSAIGARITIAHRDSLENVVSQMREVQSGNGYNSQHMLRAHFGLGSSTVIDELHVRWPSGITQTMPNVEVDQILRVVEDESGFAFDCNRNCIADITECLADIDGNGKVDVTDLLTIIGTWGQTWEHGDDPLSGDINWDHVVGVTDLLDLINIWGDC
jgi:hypothetical protein